MSKDPSDIISVTIASNLDWSIKENLEIPTECSPNPTAQNSQRSRLDNFAELRLGICQAYQIPLRIFVLDQINDGIYRSHELCYTSEWAQVRDGMVLVVSTSEDCNLQQPTPPTLLPTIPLKYPEQLVGEGFTLPWPSWTIGKRSTGFYNPGIYCYRRVALQALVHMPLFLRFIEKHNRSDAGDRSDTSNCSKSSCLTCALKEIAICYWTAAPSRGSNLIPAFDELVNKLSTKRFAINAQQDAEEFLTWILHKLHEDMISRNSGADMQQLFGTHTQAWWTCESCKLINTFHNRDEILGVLHVPIVGDHKGVEMLGHGLEQYFQEYLRAHHEVLCPNVSCVTHKDPNIKRMVQEAIVKAPEILIIHLKSVGFDDKKIWSAVDYDQILDLTMFQPSNMWANHRLIYQLAAVIRHHGTDKHSGHYTGIFNSPEGVEYISDDIVEPARIESFFALDSRHNAIRDATPYLLTYVKCSPEAISALQRDREIDA
ncbi:cysteine proteinase [Tothia fuscella]|uniref:Cysteine proteinase n=1 Tax=Tothia fuscella TaxID=1048955 RepID=A0A9P4NVA4_9PEZI|nr:cysteine proteinase [Tothia fuscella]